MESVTRLPFRDRAFFSSIPRRTESSVRSRSPSTFSMRQQKLARMMKATNSVSGNLCKCKIDINPADDGLDNRYVCLCHGLKDKRGLAMVSTEVNNATDRQFSTFFPFSQHGRKDLEEIRLCNSSGTDDQGIDIRRGTVDSQPGGKKARLIYMFGEERLEHTCKNRM